MAVSLVEYPVITDSGVIKNTFAGFDDIYLFFERQDIEVVSVAAGTNNQALITVVGDITSDASVGNWIYLYSQGANYTYDKQAQIVDIEFGGTNTTILVTADYIESGAGGYMNYKQDWFLEALLVNSTNSDIKIIDNSLKSTGSASGNVSLNVNIPVDLLCQEFQLETGELSDSRVKFKVKWRESYKDNTEEDYSLIDDYSIIVLFAAENCEAETVANQFDEPILFLGYPSSLLFCHSDDNAGSERVQVLFSELDINKDTLVSDIEIKTFNLDDYGMLAVGTQDLTDLTLNENTQYGKLTYQTTTVADFDSDDFDSDDFDT